MDINVCTLNEAEEKCSKAEDTKTDDHISQLPEDILSSILSILTMRDAVKTRVLSPRWRYLSASTANLHFDLFTIFGINYDIDYCHGKYVTKYSYDLWESKFRFVGAVDQFLQLYRTPKLHSFKICYCLGNESGCHIDRWISFAIRMQIEKIDLDFSHTPRDCELYHFPCHLLPQDKTSQLKHLCLQSCTMMPSPDLANCFNSLKVLDLNSVHFDQGDFDSILSGCINLEQLRLKNCSLPVSLLFYGRFLCLKFLFLDDCYGAEKIVVSSMDLTTFEYIGRVTNLSFVGVSFVEKVHLRFLNAFKRGTDYMFAGVAKEIPQLHILSLVLFTQQVLPIPANMTKFGHLKELELFVFLSTDFDLISVAFILNASPCLQKFHLALQSGATRGPMVKRDYSKQLYYQLKEVEISGFCDRCNALELAIYLLNSGVELERMIINSQNRWYYGYNKWINYDDPTIDELEKKRVHGMLTREKPNVELIVM